MVEWLFTGDLQKTVQYLTVKFKKCQMDTNLKALTPSTEFFFHSVTFYGNLGPLSKYKVSYMVPSIHFQLEEEFIMMKAIHFGNKSKFVIKGEYPQKFDFYLILRKETSRYTKKYSLSIDSSNNYLISRADYLFNKETGANVTFYIRTGANNPIILVGRSFHLSFDSLLQIGRNTYILRDNMIAKKVRLTTFNNLRDESMREILPFFELAEHDCIVKYFGYSQIDDNLFIILEKFGDSLDKHIKKRDLDNEKILKIIVCVCCGLINMHQHNYIHRDIKPGNIVVNESGEAKLIDFGISRPFSCNDLTEEVGTSRYMAPEVFGGEYDFRCDIYSVGVIILEMISDVSISDFMNGKELIDIPSTTQIVLRSIISPNPKNRPTLDEIIYMILNKIFLLTPDICGYDKNRFNENEKRKTDDLKKIFKESYEDIVSEYRNDFNYLIKTEDDFFFHFGIFIYYGTSLNEMCDIFYIGHLLGDEYCSYMLEAMEMNEMFIAHNAYTMHNDLTKLFMSLPSKNFRSYVLLFPQNIKNNYYVVDELITDKIFHRKSSPQNSLLNKFIDYYERLKRKPEVVQTTDLVYQLERLATNIRDGNIKIIDCYHIIALLYCIGVKFEYLYYFASISRNEEFIGIIIYMFGKKNNLKEACDHLMKSKSSHALDALFRINIETNSYDQEFVNHAFPIKMNFLFPYFYALSIGKSFCLMPFYSWMHYLLTGNADYLKLVCDNDNVNEFGRKDTFAEELRLFCYYWKCGQFKNARESIKHLSIRYKECDFLLIYLAIVKFGEGDIANGLINLSWAPKRHSMVCLTLGHFYFHGYRLQKNRELGIEFLRAAGVDGLFSLSILYLRGVYVDQNIELALNYFSQSVEAYPVASNYIKNILAKNFYFPVTYDKYINYLTCELQLSEDFVPFYDGSCEFGIYKQKVTFYFRHSQFQNPLAMYCLAHCASDVDKAIYWLEQSAQFELDISFNELAYLYFAYKYNTHKAEYYSKIAAKLGLFESQMILYYLKLSQNNEITHWDVFTKNVGSFDSTYPYIFEGNINEIYQNFRMKKIAIQITFNHEHSNDLDSNYYIKNYPNTT